MKVKEYFQPLRVKFDGMTFEHIFPKDILKENEGFLSFAAAVAFMENHNIHMDFSVTNHEYDGTEDIIFIDSRGNVINM